ncbi:sugar ABC transporter substrate-binding protein [Geodermatophilus sabuli]|uniref:sugar ABC transporter substrate-binding protein n=1 Tax=Geodermatophilus sabuli TaxID=1564158 RepID=UPI0015598945|nr:sugar ABC transporter substrate-binding protein [Geodermatophilus sabuli]MBB3082527.1 ABC-type sugar transport system substrate-binding protein [Geodermatophilus sabuli]
MTLSVADDGPFSGLVTGSNTITPTVDGDQVTIDVGGTEVTVDKDKKLKVGFFVNGAISPFFQTAFAWAEAQAEAYGYEVEQVDGAYDPAKQADQIQTAISTKKYDAIIVIPVDGVGSCDSFTKQAAEAGILVVDYYNPMCGKDAEPINNWYVPGLLGVVGGGTDPAIYQAFVERAMAAHPEGKGMSLNLEASMCTCAGIYTSALDAALEEYPGVDLTQTAAASPDKAGGQSVTEQYLKDNPDAEFILSLADETGAGAVEAVEAAGLTDQVKVYMSGGTPAIMDLMAAGKVHGTHPYYMGSAVQSAMLMLHEAVAGNPVPTVIANDGHVLDPFADQTAPFLTLVTPDIARSGGYVPNSVDNAQAR